MRIVKMTAEHWPEVARIYEEGLATGMASFETRIPEYAAWDHKMHPYCRLVGVQGDALLGWAALAPVSQREVYRAVAEVSIYMAGNCRGKGYGKQLLDALVRESEVQGIYSLQSSVFPQNAASIRLHEAAGFRLIGYREKIAFRDGAWQDNLLFERRSSTIAS